MSGAGRSGAKRPAPARQDLVGQEFPVLRPIAVRPAEPAASTEEHHLGEALTAYLDGELGHDARERVQSHLATCPSCLAEAEAARAVKQLLTRTEAPGPSGMLMARLLAVAALPEDDGADDGPRDGSGGLSSAELPSASLLGNPSLGSPSLGGSRLTGGSFGRGAGASFGSGALGSDAPLPGVDPRAGRGPDVRLWSGRRGGAARAAASSPERQRPAAVLPISRPGVPRGRRLVVAAAGAFSVAAVTLGGFGSLGLASVAGDTPLDDQHGNAVNPQVPGNVPGGPLTAPLTVNFPLRPSGGHPYDLLTPGPLGHPGQGGNGQADTGQVVNPVVNGRPFLP
ncbi:zf-HC2 domain-containing protein [Kitasatospora azatica]|uniref:zf-HC2 domain-containing protein n=1 Tax=Kitasatospora azatica TaxID=58347 RepID=UPI0005605735|nr:zf-HC2 domain-containing protein [Kitasatospora azatica]